MTFKQKLLYVYLAGIPLFTLYGWIAGPHRHRSFFYNLGVGLAWPITLFPQLGELIGMVLLVGLVLAVLIFGKRKDEVEADR